jgi:hypothetical protein
MKRDTRIDSVISTLHHAIYLLNAIQDGGGGGQEKAASPGRDEAAMENNIGVEPMDKSSRPAPAIVATRKRNRDWTPAEDAILLSGISLAEVAERTGRTRCAAHDRRRKLTNPEHRKANLAGAKRYIALHQAASRPAAANYKRWTAEEDAVVCDPKLTREAAAHKLGRSFSAVHRRRVVLLKRAEGRTA